jgi:hypothetical protein
MRARRSRRIFLRRDDGAATDLPAADAGVLYAAIVSPFTGVVHVRLALPEQPAVAGERINPFRAGHVALDLFRAPLVAVGSFDQQSFLREQALVIRDQLRQTLERCGKIAGASLAEQGQRL